MGLFNFGKKKEEVTEPINIEDIKTTISTVKPITTKKYNLLCINFGINDYAFTLTANSTGKIVINKSINRNEYNDINKTNELVSYIEDNLKKIKEFTTRVSKDNHQNNNMLQFEVDTEKFTLFRSDIEDDMSMFYDKLLFDIANIFELDKTYEDVSLNLTFEYPNYWENIPGDISKYALLSSSTPVLALNDHNNIITFEYAKYKEDLISGVINDINNSPDYEVLDEFDNELGDYTVKSIIIDYKETNNIELFSFITFNDYIIITTIIIGSKDEVNMNDIKNDENVKAMLKTIKSFKALANIEDE